MGDLTTIQVVIRRAKKIGCPVILATTDDSSDNSLAALAEKEGIHCFRGAVKNKIKRWADCFNEYGIEFGLLVDGDDPTFDFNVGFRALQKLGTGDCDFVVADPEMTPGFFTYGISNTGIQKLFLHAPHPELDTDVITEFIKRAGLKSSLIPALPNETTGHRLRLTIDYPEDVQFYRELYSMVDYRAPSTEIVGKAIELNLSSINWHRHEEFLENQNKFNERVRTHG